MISFMKKLILLILMFATNLAFATEYTHYFEAKDGQKVLLESAYTDYDKARGLMGRPSLPENTGMVFCYNSNVEQSFWMKNVTFPLDLIYLREGTVTRVYKKIQPCTTDICRIYPSKGLIDQVIEVPAGFCADNKIKKGSIIRVKELIE